jgi:cytochrome c oxidase cbb3-type subunit 2
MTKSNATFRLMIVLTMLAISVGGLVEIVPLFFQKSTTTPTNELVKPYDAAAPGGRDIYIREGCYNCHSQMIRPFRAETERYGHYSVAGEFVYDHPFQWGSKRTGPDLASCRRPLFGPVALDPPDESARRRARVEHAGLFLAGSSAQGAQRSGPRCAALRAVGVPYTDKPKSPVRRRPSRARLKSKP